MSKVSFFGGVNVGRIHMENDMLSDDYKNYISSLGMSDDTWNENSVVLANMNNSLSGNGSDYQFNNIIKFKIYKKIGMENEKFYKVYETANPNERIVEDFAVGDNCEYKYYVYPICSKKIDGVNVETYGSPIISKSIKFNRQILSVAELTQDYDDKTIYRVDPKSIWLFSLNLDDGGTTLNTNKLFSDTQGQYQQETASFRKHKSKNISALIGNFDCATCKYTDTFEKLEAWDKFCSSDKLKVLVDLRGRIIIGDIDNNPQTEYEQGNAKVSFSFNELSDIDNISVLGRSVTEEEFIGYKLVDYSVSEDNLVLSGFDYVIDVFGDMTFRLIVDGG